MTHHTPRLADIVPSTAREPEDTGTWTKTDSGMFTRFLPSTWHHHINQHLDGLCMEEVTADFSGRTHACHQPAKSLAYDTFTRQHYPVCQRHQQRSS